MRRFKPKVSWFSPRAAKEPTSRVNVVEEQTGPNSFRYKAVKTVSRLETRNMDQGLTYETYKAHKTKKETRNHNQWSDDAYGYGVYDSPTRVHYNTPMYSWEPKRWSNWNYNSFLNLDTDSNDNLFVKEPENYLTPTIVQIRAKINYSAGEDMQRIKELCRVCYLKMIDDQDYIHKDYKNGYGNIGSEEWNEKKTLFDSVYETYVPGFTPLEQAIAINHKVRDQKSKANQRKTNNKTRAVGSITFRRDDYADPTINQQMSLNGLNNGYSLDILNRISLMRDLGSQFMVKRDIGEHEVNYSDYHKTGLMSSYDQIRMISLYQRMLHGYNIKFLTKSLVVDIPIESSERKQKIIILLDFSGSMDYHEKQLWVNSILVDRFRYVIKGEAEIFFSYFVSSPSLLKFMHIKDEEDVKRFWKNFSNEPNGSFTNIGRIVTHVAQCIENKNLHNLNIDLSKERPEILIINDGEDEVGYDAFPYKVNAVSLFNFSSELKDLCVASGGKQVMIYKDTSIEAFSKNGRQKIA